jgi:hypothetical protein
LGSVASNNTLIYEKTTKAILNVQGLIYNSGFQMQNKCLDYLLGIPIEVVPAPIAQGLSSLAYTHL